MRHPIVNALPCLGTIVFVLAAAPCTHAAAPVVPGYARLSAGAKPDIAEAGRLLLGELNCVRCHRPDAAQQAPVLEKSAPVLDGVGSRVRRAYLRQFLADPHATKPGTTMPDLLAGVPAAEKPATVEALVHFLAGTGSPRRERPDRRQIAEGRQLFHRVGCVACHGSRDAKGGPDRVLPASVPLGDLKAKYTLPGLRAFLAEPHRVRPSGRMPGLLNEEEARRVANYLLQGAAGNPTTPNMRYAYFEGSWDRLPDFDRLKPKASGAASDFDLSVARRPSDFAVRFEGWLQIPRDGDYRFHVTSDDGSKLLIDGRPVIDNDGIHAPTSASGRVHLSKGGHQLSAAVFNAGGGVELQVEVEGPGLPRQPAAALMSLDADGRRLKAGPKPDDEDAPIRAELVAKGRQLFAGLGCANCHRLTVEQRPIEPALSAPALAKLRPGRGCLATTLGKSVPWFGLAGDQRAALAAALQASAPRDATEPRAVIRRTLTAFNCYACHERDQVGGVDDSWNALFTTTQPEMGDEARIPPSLTGVGAKLTADYLRQILDRGAKDRPYMHTRMPRFGEANVGKLVAAFAAVDVPVSVPAVQFHQPLSRVKADARGLVGGLGLGCIKCHTFAGHKAEGVQAIDLTLLTRRLRHDWFHRYMLNPPALRPGTRMPAAWPGGTTFFTDVLGGDTARQIEAIWVYLSDGSRAQLPPGLKKQSIPLVPDKEAIVYRNFIEGAGPRAIAVGYPEKAHLAFDANDLRLALLWQGAFLDAARHWTDRGSGFEPPLGDNVLRLPDGVAFATLGREDEPWPTKKARQLGYQFRGYRLTKDQRPTFLYTCAGVQVEDEPNAVAGHGKEPPSLRRTLTLTATSPVPNLWFRAAAAAKIEPAGGGWYRIDGEWKLRLEGPAAPRIRQSGGKQELLVPVRFDANRARIVEEFVW